MTDAAPLGESYFLSYSRADERVALKFATDLRDAGIAMWVDQFDIRPSEHWDRAIERAVRECRGLVVMLSPRSTASDNVADEISFALDHSKSVLPVMIERCPLPLRITRMQVIDATGDYERALQQCVAVLRGNHHAPLRAAAPQVRAGWVTDAETIATAKTRLVQVLGPIGALLVDKDAARASSTGELYDMLAQHIENTRDREQFLKLAGGRRGAPSPPEPLPKRAEPASESVASAEIDRLTSILTHYLGPMAAVVAKRESNAAGSAAELKQRLASRIPHERERAQFLKQAGDG